MGDFAKLNDANSMYNIFHAFNLLTDKDYVKISPLNMVYLSRATLTLDLHQPLILLHAMIHYHSHGQQSLSLHQPLILLHAMIHFRSHRQHSISLHQPPIFLNAQLHCHSQRLYLYALSLPIILLHSQSAKTLISKKVILISPSSEKVFLN